MSNWIFTSNTFEIATRTNYRKTLQISTMHNSSLQHTSTIEPLLLPLFSRYQPVHKVLVDAYAAWQTSGGVQSGQTLSLVQQMALAYAKIDDWDLNIQLKYKKSTTTYKTLLPSGRKPFYTGTTNDRINAYNTFAVALAKVANLKSIADAVAATYATLDEARSVKQGTITGTSNSSEAVEAARIAAMNMMHRNLGYCIDNFNNRPAFIESLFDLENIRSHSQNHFTGTLKNGDKKEVFVHTFLADDGLHLRSNGNGTLSVYLASSATATDSTAIVVPANTDTHIKIAHFAATDLGTNRHLVIVNNGPETTQFVVDLE
ncbi:MAG: hypothetical protein QM541_05230 [Flavobacterium sp.]|nr:hypothetical protein [Flavobacterium sp.]